MRGQTVRRAGAGILLGLAAATAAAAQDAGSGSYGPAAVPLVGRAEGVAIRDVAVRLRRSAGNPAREEAILIRVREALAGFAGSVFSRPAIEGRLAGIRARIGTGRIDYRLVEDGTGTTLLVEVDAADGGDGSVASGIVKGRIGDFPLLYRSDRATFTAILSGGFGVYSDTDAWFGDPATFAGFSPIAGHLPGRTATWTEGFVEYGLGGAAQIGDTPFYGYGALTGLTSWTVGQDIYRDDARALTAVEKAYAGLLYVDPERGFSANVSVGSQNVTLNDGFLVHFVKGSANIDERGGTYLGPRNANDLSVVADVKAGDWALKAFYIDPNELESLEKNNTFLGFNVRRALADGLSVDASLITIPDSDSAYANPFGLVLPREGVTTVAGHVRWNHAFGVRGLWLESELAHQGSPDFDMSAFAGYGLIGYRASELPWSPSLSYRFSAFSGDDPTTERYERYDPLLATGLGNWLQGVNFGKLVSNSNLSVHRLQFNVQPDPRLNLTLDWHLLQAAETNNLGSNPALSTLSSLDIGNELTLTARWAISDKLYLQSLASVAFPGEALRDVGADDPWLSLQASLYWSF